MAKKTPKPRTGQSLADPPGLSLLESRWFIITNSLDGLEYEFLIAVKRDGQVVLMFFNASFPFGELKAFLASTRKRASADVLPY